MVRIVLACTTGLEDLMCAEVASCGLAATTILPGKVLLDATSDDEAVRLNWVARQAHRVYLLAWRGQARTLEEIQAAASEVDFSRYMESAQTFAVRGARQGEHPFRSPDVARVVGTAVTDHFRGRGVRVRANLDAPDVEFHAELSDTHLMVLVNTTGASLIRRHLRVFQHFAPLPPTLAAALLSLSSFPERPSLLDPMAGGGTILTEAAMMAAGVPPGAHVAGFAYERLACIGRDAISRMVRDAQQGLRTIESARIGGCDTSPKSVVGMRDNFAAQGVADRIESWQDDAGLLTRVETGAYRSIVTNPPYAMRVGSPRVVRLLYERFPQAAMDKGIEELIVTTPRSEWMIDSLVRAGYRVEEVRRILYGELSSTVICAKR